MVCSGLPCISFPYGKPTIDNYSTAKILNSTTLSNGGQKHAMRKVEGEGHFCDLPT